LGIDNAFNKGCIDLMYDILNRREYGVVLGLKKGEGAE
jgi:hypothetical protein